MRHIKEYNQLFESEQELTQELTQEQKDWLDKCVFGKWWVNPQTGLVDVDMSFQCSGQGPGFNGVRFGHIRKNFICSESRLSSLDGAPQSVGESFSCNFNSLTTLEGEPKEVGGNFNCAGNSLTSLVGAPQRVGGDFYFINNPISDAIASGVLKRMRGRKISLEQAVSELWSEIPEEDKIYLAKHNSDLSPQEKRGYEALERMKTRII